MKSFYTFWIIVLLAVSACKSNYDAPCRDAIVADSLVFSPAHFSNIPYSAHDTVLYVSDAGDSMVFLTSLYNDNPAVFLTDKPGNPECPNNDYISFDVLNVKLINNSNTTELYFGAGRTTDSCVFSISGYGAIALPLSALGSRDSTYIDSVYLFNKIFYGVNRFANEQGDSFFINGGLGLLQFKQNAKQFTLQKFNSK
jgi:hypothetical protein